MSISGSKSLDDFEMVKLSAWLCGEFRDELYASKVLPFIQEECGFDEGEAYLLRVGAFSMWSRTASWCIYDLKLGVVKEGRDQDDMP